MRAGRLETYLHEVWYAQRPGYWLRPLAALYAGALRLRERLYAWGVFSTVRVGVPVIVVGNLTVGGTGKTPLVLYLVEALRAAGRAPGVISRGYGGHADARRALLVDAHDDPAVVGDEPLLLARRGGCPVAVCPDRVRAAYAAIAAGADILVADDGLQHKRLARDAQIVVVDGVRRLGNGRCLPAGPLRGLPGEPTRIDATVVNDGGAADALRMSLRATDAVRLGGAERRPLHEFRGRRVHAVAAIGHPERFFATLRDHGLEVIAHAHRDHSPLGNADLAFDDGLPVFITEKDAVKCASGGAVAPWVVPVDAVLNEAADAAVRAVIERVTG